jgi:hypothetical protein
MLENASAARGLQLPKWMTESLWEERRAAAIPGSIATAFTSTSRRRRRHHGLTAAPLLKLAGEGAVIEANCVGSGVSLER